MGLVGHDVGGNEQVSAMFRVLVVDDEPTVSETVQAGLEEFCGAEVMCRETGAAGVAALREKRLDAALFDVDLPDMSGFELAERAVSLNIPVLLMPGHPSSIDICQHCDYPHLPKPFLPEDLAERTLRLIRAAEGNIAQVRAATERLKANAAGLAETMADTKLTVAQTREILAQLSGRR